MPTHKVAHDRHNPYVCVSTILLNDSRLSWRAKGILSYVLSKPNGWVVRISDLMRHGKEGRDATYRSINELIILGYVRRCAHRESNGVYERVEYWWYEIPMLSQDATVYEKQTRVETDINSYPLTGNPYTGNQHLSK